MATKGSHSARKRRTVASTNAAAALSADDIAARLTAAIVERRLAPGTRLIEDELGQVFGVSRTKVREALLHLDRIKLITWPAGRSAQVAQPSVSEARQVFEARRVIEAATAARL